jgi:class 3 adenylate cyclase
LSSEGSTLQPAAIAAPTEEEPNRKAAAERPRRRWRPSILLVLLLGFGGLTVIAAGTVTLIGYEIARRNTYELIGIATQSAMAQRGTTFTTALEPAEAAVRALAGALERRELDPDDPELTSVLEGAVIAAPQIGFVAYADRSHNLVGAGRAFSGLSAGRRSLRAWPDLRLAVREGERQEGLLWRGPSFVPSLGSSFILVTVPVHRGGAYIGLAVAGVGLEALSTGADAGTADTVDFVLRGADEVLAHPALAGGARGLSPEHPVPRIGDIGDPVLAAYAAGEGEALGPPLASEQLLGRAVTANGQDYVMFYREVTGYDRVPWLLGRYFPQSRAAQILKRLSFALLAGGAAVLMSLVLAVLLARLLARGIGRLADAAQRVARLELEDSKPLPGSMLAELDRAARAFNAMRAGLAWFETYVPRQLVKRLLRLGDKAEFAPVERELTVMFTDVVGFSAISQRLSPPRLAAFINRHFGMLAGAIEAEGGTVDKYIGDSVMAFWGAPAKDAEHAAHACRAALAIAARIGEDNERRRRKGLNPVRIRIGLHTGPAVAGNIGAPGRVNYTLIGDTVNVAQRLEQLGKTFDDGADAIVIASARTVATMPSEIPRRALGSQSVRGIEGPIEVYRLG